MTLWLEDNQNITRIASAWAVSAHQADTHHVVALAFQPAMTLQPGDRRGHADGVAAGGVGQVGHPGRFPGHERSERVLLDGGHGPSERWGRMVAVTGHQ